MRFDERPKPRGNLCTVESYAPTDARRRFSTEIARRAEIAVAKIPLAMFRSAVMIASVS